jgi:hypothetical protein
LIVHGSADFTEAKGETISHLLAQIALGLFQPRSHVSGGCRESLGQRLVERVQARSEPGGGTVPEE